MKGEKDIGKLIAERLSDSEVEQPNNLMWKTIEKTLMRRRFIRIGLISVSAILVLASLSYLLILPTVQEKRDKKQTVPKTSEVTKNSSSDSNSVKSDGKKESENQIEINSSNFKDSINRQNLIEEDTSYRKPFFTQTRNSAKNPKNKNSKEVLLDEKSRESLRNPVGKSNDDEKLSAYTSKKTDVVNANQKQYTPTSTQTNDRDVNNNANESKNTTQKGNPEIAEESWRFKDETPTKQGVVKNDKHPHRMTESDSLRSKRIDSLTPKKSNKISKTDRKLKKNVVDSTDKKKKFNFESYFLPVVNASLYGRLKDRSTISAGLDGNEKTANLRFGFGGYGVVRVTSKFDIRLGVLYSNYSKKTFDVDVIPSDISTNYYTNVNFKNGLNYESFSNSFSQPTQITLQEELTYLEFPVDFGFVVWKKNKWTADLIAGASAAILIENRLNALTESDTLIFLGENTNYTKNILSIRLGAGVYYNFNDYLALRLEILSKPTFGTFQTSQADNPILLNANLGIAIRL